jgi:hypothetical protein
MPFTKRLDQSVLVEESMPPECPALLPTQHESAESEGFCAEAFNMPDTGRIQECMKTAPCGGSHDALLSVGLLAIMEATSGK